MRVELGCAVLAVAIAAAAATAGAQAPASDSARVGIVVRDSIPPPPPPPAIRRQSTGLIDMNAERKIGTASLAEALRPRRAVILGALPLSGPIQGTLWLPDGGGPIRLDGPGPEFETATDEPLIGSIALGWGAPWLAFSLSDPRGDAVDALDLDSIEFPPERDSFRGPGDVLRRPVPRGPAFGRGDADSGDGVSKTTLLYQRGDGDAQLTGIRFQTTVARRRLYASYGRNQANGWAPLRKTLSARYEVRAELGRFRAHRFEVEGFIYERSIQDSAGTPLDLPGDSQWDRRHVALSAAREGERSSDAWRIRLSTEKETWIQSTDPSLSPEAGMRERWEFPTLAAEGAVTWRATPALTWVASAEAASRKVVYRVDAEPAFDPRRGQARVHAGSRFALGSGVGAGIDGTYDVRESQPGLWEARASLWGDTRGVRARIDLESAADRPSYMDLFTPSRLRVFNSTPGYPFVASELFRSGNPGLKPRRLTGAIGSATVAPFAGLTLGVSGSARRVTDDFGWNVTADTVAGVYRVSSVAGARGSGWLSHAAIGWELRRGAIRSHGVGWIRGGPDSLSPQGGSPPRRAIDAGIELRVILFHGDLPLRFGVESHARGERRGLIREAGQVTWDGLLAADFGPAGAFLRVRDAFDRKSGSVLWDPALPGGASPMPGRLIQAGVTWNLLD